MAKVGRGTGRKRQPFGKERSILLSGVLVFVALQLGLSLASEFWLPELRDPPYGAKIKQLQQRTTASAQPPVTVVMLGSSRTAFGFQGKLLEGPLSAAQGRPAVVFNFGVYGAGPLSEQVYLRSLLAKGIRPDLLLVEVLPHFLDDETEEAEFGRLPGHRLKRNDLPVVEQYERSRGQDLYGDWWRSVAVPVYAHRLSILSQVLPILIPNQGRIECCRGMDDSGWLCLQRTPQTMTPEQRRQAEASVRAEYASPLARLRPDGRAGQMVRDLLTLGRREGLAMVLVFMPEGPALRNCYVPSNWQRVCLALENLSREFDSPLINARDWVAEEDFLDAHHLLHHGAEVFTMRLGREVILPYLAARHSWANLAGAQR